MAFDIATEYTLPEVLRSKAPDGSHMVAIDVLSQPLPLMEEGYWVQANDETSHQFLRMTSEPVGSMVGYNEGAAFEAATTVPVTEQIGRMESNLRIDIRILKKAPDPIKYRYERERATFRGMVKRFEKIIFSKNLSIGGVDTPQGDQTIDVKTINGLGVRMNKLVANKVVSNGASSGSDLGSIWIVKWGPDGLFFIYPRSGMRTIEIDDLKEQVVYDSASRPFRAVMTNFGWEFGLGIGDDRNIKRLCNIASSGNNSFWADGTDAAKGENNLIDLLEAMPGGDLNGVVMYAGPKIIAQIRKRLNTKSNLYFSEETVWNRKMLTFQGVPIIRVDSLTNDESALTS